MMKLRKLKKSLNKAVELTDELANQEPIKEIPITYGEIDEHTLKIIDKLATMTVEERIKFNNFQCDIAADMTMEEAREHAEELDAKIDAYLGI